MDTFDFSGKLLSLDDEPIKETGTTKEVTLAALLSSSIMASNSTEPLKPFEWALQLKKNGILTLDTTDKEKLEQFICQCSTLSILGKGRLLYILKNPTKKRP
jgi:hypothetical protein